MKKGQFFLIALLLLALSMFVLFSFFRTTDTASVTLFSKSSSTEIKNIQNAIIEKNEWVSNNSWWNASWAYRLKVTNTDQQALAEIDLNITSDKITNCDNEIRVVNTSVVDSNVTNSTWPCNVTFKTCSGCDYYIYYGNADAAAPARGVSHVGTVITPTLSEESGGLCDHFEYIYSIQGVDLECVIVNDFSGGGKANYSIKFTSPDLEFEGYIG